jgi:hypothetical protein
VPEFVVEKIIGQREWAPADDPTRKTVFYEFTAEGVEKVCSIGRKPDNPLKVGDRFEATSTEDRGKLKLKRVQSFGGGGGFKPDPKKDARITRQHSQDMGLRTLSLARKMGVELKIRPATLGDLVAMVKTLADAYDKDAYAAGEKA